MCKLGDKDYWQVGDEVYCTSYGKGKVVCVSKYSGEVRVESQFLSAIIADDYTKTGQHSHSRTRTTLFHIGAITFDEQDRPIAINYDYVPDRTPKVMVTKLPHEFIEGEEVLIRYDRGIGYGGTLTCWIKDNFSEYAKPALADKYYFMLKCTKTASHCIPYKGNERCEGKSTNCESGKVPEDYVFPKKELFSDVKVGDILYRLHEGKYVEGKVTDRTNIHLYLKTKEPTSLKDVENSLWQYNLKGGLVGQKELGQVLFFEKPKHVFKPFDRVLVKKLDWEWKLAFFSHEKSHKVCPEFKYYIISNTYEAYTDCIPFEGNERLLGTTDNI